MGLKLPIASGFAPMYDIEHNLTTNGAGVASTHAALTDSTVVAALAADTIVNGFTESRKPSTRGLRDFSLWIVP